MIHHHLPEDRLAAYAAGTAGEADALLVASHLVLCPDCRRRVAEYEALGGISAKRERVRARLPSASASSGSSSSIAPPSASYSATRRRQSGHSTRWEATSRASASPPVPAA